MFLQFVLVVVMALSGLASPGPQVRELSARDSSPQVQNFERADSGAGQATEDLRIPAAARSDGVRLKDVDIVVPPVAPSGQVVAPGALEPQMDTGVVVADQLVTSKRVESEVVKTAGFQLVGVTWPENAKVGDLGGQVRSRTHGKWSGWVDLAPSDMAPDAGTPDAARALRSGTDPVPIGDADAVQLAFTANAKGGPKGLSLALVGSSEQPVSGGVVTSAAGGRALGGAATIQTAAYSTAYLPALVQAAAPPAVIPRAQWAAPAQACRPDVASALVGAVVHHTAGPNTYTTVAQAKRQIRNDAVYHISRLGWCDIGYNFIVDKWGNIYEGRARSQTQAIVGAHAGGFNTGTVGVAMLGTYGAAPSAATQRSVAQIIGWRLGYYGVDPKASMVYRTGDGGAGARYKNRSVTLPRVSGHRDVWFTACPGNGGQAALPRIRAMASSFSYSTRFTQARAIVKALYADLLGREVDPSGLQTWSTLFAGGRSQATLVASLTGSTEYVRLRVRQAYQAALGRDVDVAGLAWWTKEILARRIPVDDVQRRLYASQEFVDLSGGSPEGWVANLYQTILGRAAPPGEIAGRVAQLPHYGRAWVVDRVWLSTEAASIRAGGYYQLFLKRAPDPAGQGTWAKILLTRGEGAVRTGIAGSAEYRRQALGRYP